MSPRGRFGRNGMETRIDRIPRHLGKPQLLREASLAKRGEGYIGGAAPDRCAVGVERGFVSLSVIIPSRTATNLVPCITAIGERDPEVRIIVVDDGLEMSQELRKLFPTQFLAGVKPFVFARNVNLGIHAAGTDDVILLNDDALLKTED